MTHTSMPTIKELLADAKRLGLDVTRAGQVNNGPAFRVAGRVGMFTKVGLMGLVGYPINQDEVTP